MGVLRYTKRKAIDHHSLVGLLQKLNIAYFVSFGPVTTLPQDHYQESPNNKYPTLMHLEVGERVVGSKVGEVGRCMYFCEGIQIMLIRLRFQQCIYVVHN